MSSAIGEAFVTIRPDTQGFEQETTAGIQGTLTRIAGLIGGAIVFRKVGDQIVSAVDAGSDLNETISKTEVVFGKNADAALRFGNNAATAFGTSKRDGLEMLSTLGNLFVSMGLTSDQSLDMSKSMVTLAGDLGSFNNVPTVEALEAIRAGLIGETEPLRRFGVNLNEATIQAKAMALGISDGKTALTPAQKAQAAYALILEQTTTAQGDFARTSDGAANKQKILQARMEDIRAKIGQGLVPIYEKLLTVGSKVITWLQKHQTVAKALGVVVGTVLLGALAAWAVAMYNVAAATLAATWPIIAVGAAIAALVAGVYLLWNNWDTVWGWIKDHPAIAAIIAILAWPITLIVATVAAVKLLYENWSTIWPAVQGVLQDVWSVLGPILEWIGDRIGNVIDVAQWLADRAPGVWSAVQTAVSTVWEVLEPIFHAWREVIERVAAVALYIGDHAGGWFSAFKNAVVDMWNGVQAPLNWIWNRLKDIAAAAEAVTGALRNPLSNPFGGSGDIGAVQDALAGRRAKGGSTRAGASYIVGEDGPEVWTSPGNGTVIPNHALGGMYVENLIVQSGREVAMLDYWAATRMAGG